MFGQGLQQAITAPRWLLGKTWGEDSVTLKLESRFDPALVAALRAAGHDVEMLARLHRARWAMPAPIVRHPNGLLEGATRSAQRRRGDGVLTGGARRSARQATTANACVLWIGLRLAGDARGSALTTAPTSKSAVARRRKALLRIRTLI